MPPFAGTDQRLDSVEIKVTFPGAGAAAAIRALAPDQDGGLRRHVYFCEALARSRAPGQLPLLDAGVILRLRSGSGRAADVTARLRPCRRSRLTDRWLDFREQGPHAFRLDGHWSGENRSLAASLVSTCSGAAIEAVASGTAPLAPVFSDCQRTFLAQCADVPVRFDALRLLGPVHSVRWSAVRLDHHEVALEHWTLPATPGTDAPLDWLEVSERVPPQGAELVQASLTSLLRTHGLDPPPGQHTKTRGALEALARGT
jgi:hypothetical protein